MIFGPLLALAAAAFSASKDILSKKLSFNISGMLSAFASFAYAIPLYIVLLLIIPGSWQELLGASAAFWTLVFLRSLTDSGAEWCKMAALRGGEISAVSALLALSPVFVLILSPALTSEIPSLLSSLGVLVVILGNLMIIWDPRLKKLRESISKRTVLIGTLGAVLFALNSCFDKLAVQEASPLISAFAMTVGAALLLSPALFRVKGFRAKLIQGRKALWARAVLEVLFMVSKLWALTFLQAPYVAAITRLSLVFAVVGGGKLFDEGQLRRKAVGALTITVGGIMVVLGAG